MGKPDLISRRADYDRGDMDNADVVFLKDEWMVRGAVVTERDGVLEKVKEAQKRVKEGDRPKGLVEVDGIWRTRKNNCIFVPDEVKAEVLQAYHDSPLAGHPGSTKTVGLVQREYWWPTVFGDVRSYVRGCDRCQRTKALRQTRARVLHLNEVPEGVTIFFISFSFLTSCMLTQYSFHRLCTHSIVPYLYCAKVTHR